MMALPRLFLLDNYDSFTYNLQHYFLQLDFQVTVRQHDETSLTEIERMQPRAIVLSPGPKTPSEAGVMMEVIRQFHEKIPLLGICLGHQAIGEFFGLKLVHARKPMHGKVSPVHYIEHPLFAQLPNPFPVMRYHSLILEENPAVPLRFIAHTPEKELMGFVHSGLPVAGFQFHPESILTPQGMTLLRNWKYWIGA